LNGLSNHAAALRAATRGAIASPLFSSPTAIKSISYPILFEPVVVSTNPATLLEDVRDNALHGSEFSTFPPVGVLPIRLWRLS
jgi:hypothetical protein